MVPVDRYEAAARRQIEADRDALAAARRRIDELESGLAELVRIARAFETRLEWDDPHPSEAEQLDTIRKITAIGGRLT